jgi:quercetin dioxygenase-like cupin family protein
MPAFSRVSFTACAISLSAAVLAQTPAAPAAGPQATPNIKRTPLQTVDVPAGSYNAITAIAEIVPNAVIGRHTHLGPETGYMIEGEMTLMIDGQAPKVVKAGESYQVPAGVVHDAKAGDKGAKVMGVYIIEKGKPLAIPAQ